MMHYTVKKVIGKHTHEFTFIGEDFFEVVMESQQLGFYDVYKCGLCDSDHLYLRAYKTEKGGFEYVKICCGACKAQLTFGKTKKDGDFFLRRNEDKTYAWEKMPELNNEQ